MSKKNFFVCAISFSLYVRLIAYASFLYAAYIAISFSGQPPLDLHEFRQAQTAITSHWFLKEGISLQYQTPVAGFPWSIPFEFPIYQILVALFSNALGLDTDMAGRNVSFLFLILTLYPVWSLNKYFGLPKETFYIFMSLLFTTPLYLYWGRAFMIETSALFFGMMSINFFIKYVGRSRSKSNLLFFIFFSIIAVLQKSTTAVPILLGLSILYFFVQIYAWDRKSTKRLIEMAVYILLVVAVGYVWVMYTDSIKQQNQFGSQITSAALSGWNYGSIDSRFSSTLWLDVVFDRIFNENVGSLLGFLSLFLVFDRKFQLKNRLLVFALLLFFLLPLLLFTNLHIVHDYYQVSNVIFVIMALSIVVAVYRIKYISFIVFSFLVIFGFVKFNSYYLNAVKTTFDMDNRNVGVGNTIQANTSEDAQVVIFGNDWSSSIAYMSKRKSFTPPTWFKEYSNALVNPDIYVEKDRFGALVYCQDPKSALAAFDKFSLKDNWALGHVANCFVGFPKTNVRFPIVESSQCVSSLDINDVSVTDSNFREYKGSLSIKNNLIHSDSKVFIELISRDYSDYLEVIKIPTEPISKNDSVFSANNINFSLIGSNFVDYSEAKMSIIYYLDGVGYRCLVR